MSEPNKIEFTRCGKKQLENILYPEIKSQVEIKMNELIERRINAIIKNKVEKIGHYTIESKVEKVIRDVWWEIVEKMLIKADFQAKLKEEIIAYLHEQWACGSVPFDEHLNKALKRALKELIK